MAEKGTGIRRSWAGLEWASGAEVGVLLSAGSDHLKLPRADHPSSSEVRLRPYPMWSSSRTSRTASMGTSRNMDNLPFAEREKRARLMLRPARGPRVSG